MTIENNHLKIGNFWLNKYKINISELGQMVGLVNLFKGISTPYGLFNAEIWFISKWCFQRSIIFSKIAFYLLVRWFQVFLYNVNNLDIIMFWFSFMAYQPLLVV